MTSDECAYRDYAVNLIRVWDKPRADTPVGQALNFRELDLAVDMLRRTLADDAHAHDAVGGPR